MEKRFPMLPYFTFGIYLLVFLRVCNGELEICDRRPFKTNTEALAPDDRFEVEIEGITKSYIPLQRYNVRLFSKDDKTTFTGFSIWLREDEVDNDKNSRRKTRLDPGKLHPSPDLGGGKSHPHCNNTIIQMDITAKTSIQALWTAPGKGNKCVTVNALVAIKPDVWYASVGPLSKQVCEDSRDADDILPTQNDDCQVCEQARYQLTFRGMWSFNTHPNMFPKDLKLARFSDVVGASHSKSFTLYKFNSEASPGIQMLAEQGNTTDLELEIQKELGRSVRTVIKASAPARTNLTTVTSFRVSKENHFVSLATGIMPSPDWFLGVANLELCSETKDKKSQWAETVTLNLYPYDAGTDSGKEFESSNDKTSPPQPISSLYNAQILSKEKKAFARVRFDLIRTYPHPDCTVENPTTTTEEGYEVGSSWEEEHYEPPRRMPEQETTSTSEKPEIVQTEFGTCPMTPWEEWACQGYGVCEDGVEEGMRMKFRYHIVDGVIVGKFNDNSYATKKLLSKVPQHCQDQTKVEMENCILNCTETTESEVTTEEENQET